MSLSRVHDVSQDLAAGAADVPIAVFSERTKIEKIILVPELAVVAGAVDYVTITIVNKGVGGVGATILATITTDSGDPDGISLDVFLPVIKVVNIDIDAGSVLSVVKADAAGAIDLGTSLISVVDRRY